jgi:hypothetical protein
MRLQRRFSLRGLMDIHVVRATDQQSLGYLSDISSGGFRITGLDPMAPERELLVELRIPVRNGHQRSLILPVLCKWSRRDGRTRRFNAGVQLQEDSQAFLQLVSEVHELQKRNRRAFL